MRTTILRATLCGVTLLALAPSGAVRAAEGDVALSGKLRYNAVLEVAGQALTTYEVTTLEYIFEAAPATVGFPQPLDHDIVRELCGDKDGCEITLQMANWDTVGEPDAVASRTSWMFLAELPPPDEDLVFPTSMPVDEGKYFRFDEVLGISGTDDDFFEVVSKWELFDCIFTDGESGSGENALVDDDPGFALLNCKEDGDDCGFSDTTTVCRVVMRD